MPASPAWHARVDHAGTVLGSAFLVAPDMLLTCAHVVHHVDEVSVWFPGAQVLGSVPARVVARGPWGGSPADGGDIAVLTLDRSVGVEPIVFAEPEGAEDLGDPPRLVAYGFPEGYGQEGAQTELRMTAPGQLIHNEWNQVEYWSGYGQEPSYGFSGAAAMRAGDGRVVGMVASYDPIARNARMIPARVLAQYVPALADLVPTPGCTAEEKRELRELVHRVERCGSLPVQMDRLVRTAAGRFGLAAPTVPDGLWQGVWYLLTESRPTGGHFPAAELTTLLSDQVTDEELRRGLRSWARAYRARHAAESTPPAPGGTLGGAARPTAETVRPLEPVEPGAPLPWAPILVELRRSGADSGTVLAEVSVYRGGDRLLVKADQLTAGRLRGWVVDRIDEAYEDIVDGRPLVAFALPRGWLNKDVDQWTRKRDKEPPLGCRAPVVVLDHDRRTRGRHQFELRRVWDELDRQDGSPLHRIGCATRHRAPQLSVLLQDVRGPVGFARPPTAARERGLYGAALDAPAPIVLWPRSGCPPGEPCAGDCTGAGFLDRIAERISLLPPSELPEMIFRLRKEAFLHEGPEPHWAAAGVSLVWEDPRRFPEARFLARSPVS
ncbi:trypsin-like peptidase domain-containing protein [Streptomyces sp. ISL-99]|uniref:VMAP-C domain-containing protein n=1 Tax=Streptomyces sp. ISL-99 TaxID=2819193 RepID=UPI002554A52E|nr:trypsin-like peptidase domain-containing protein [Streptomyces sp. ISL-99]